MNTSTKYWLTTIFITFFIKISPAQHQIDAISLLSNLKTISSDEFQGRGTGQEGSILAQSFLIKQFESIGIQAIDSSYIYKFGFLHRIFRKKMEGSNLIGYIPGTEFPNQYIVISAHYDHLGLFNEKLYNGADDNASGTCALLAMGSYFVENPPKHSIIIAAFDAEEQGLIGAERFVDEPPVPIENILLNLNMDMISRNDKNELYVCGTHHYPFLKSGLDSLAQKSPLKIALGHDNRKSDGKEDWTSSSDHGEFHRVGIPFLYFGEEDHPDYHQPTDDYENIHPAFYISAVEFILDTVIYYDKNWERIRG